MPRSFNLPAIKLKDPRVAVAASARRAAGGQPGGGGDGVQALGRSAEDLRRAAEQLRQQLTRGREAPRSKRQVVVNKVEQARKEGDEFLAKYVTDRRTTMSHHRRGVEPYRQQAGVTPKGSVTNMDPVEGSDTLWQMTISEIYEGQYANLAKLINLLDRSDRFLIISNMVATPKSSSNVLTVTLRLDTFVRAEPGERAMNLGAEPKRVAILGALVLAGGYFFYCNVISDSEGGPPPSARKDGAPAGRNSEVGAALNPQSAGTAQRAAPSCARRRERSRARSFILR